MLNSSVHAASTAVITTGRYSGLQPASTELMATFSTVHSTRSGGTTATTSSGSRVVPVSMRGTAPGGGGGGGAGGVGGGGGVVGVEGRCPAAGPVLRQSGAERRPAGQRFPLGAQPPFG